MNELCGIIRNDGAPCVIPKATGKPRCKVHLRRFKTLIERFIDKVSFTPTCWLWTGATYTYGYGMVKVKNHEEGAHRVSYVLFVGPIPDGLCVLHHCDRPLCVNPRHLFLGTKLDNVRDMIAKNRKRPGRAATLTEQQVLDVRRQFQEAGRPSGQYHSYDKYDKKFMQPLALKYGVAVDTIRNVLAEKTWKQIACR